MNSSKDAALAQVAEAAQQQDTSMLIANTNDRDERGLLRANSRKAANTAPKKYASHASLNHGGLIARPPRDARTSYVRCLMAVVVASDRRSHRSVTGRRGGSSALSCTDGPARTRANPVRTNF
jgi:hypothetical protein